MASGLGGSGSAGIGGSEIGDVGSRICNVYDFGLYSGDGASQSFRS